MFERTSSTSFVCTALLALASTLPACGGRTADPLDGGTSSGGSGGGSGGSGSGSFPYSGPSCTSTTIPPACWSCIEGSCPSFASCLTSTCSGYFDCYCACNPGDNTCLQGCQSAASPSCTSCLASSAQCVTTCTSACSTTGMGGGMGGASGGGTGSGGSGGSSTQSECTSTATQCGNGLSVSVCSTLENGACTGAYYQIVNTNSDGGTEIVPCASCTDTAACQQQATAACQ